MSTLKPNLNLSCLDYLNANLSWHKKQDKSYSLRSLSRNLGYENPSYLSSVLRGKRKLKLDIAIKILQEFRLSNDEIEIFCLKYLNESRKTQVVDREISAKIAALQNRRELKTIKNSNFSQLWRWYYTAILSMVSLKDFKMENEYVYEKLNKKIPKAEISMCLTRLQRMKLLEYSSKKKRWIPNYDRLLFEWSRQPDRYLSSHHKELLSMALQAIDEQPLRERDISGAYLAINQSDMPKIKKAIKNFYDEISEFTESETSDSCYRLNIQLFKISH